MEKQPSFEGGERAPEIVELPDNLISALEDDVIEVATRENSEIAPAEKKIRFEKMYRLGIGAALLGLVANHQYQFRDKVDSEASVDNEITWSHEDKTTEHIINTFSGKEGFNEEDKSFIKRYLINLWLTEIDSPPPPNKDNLSADELITYYLNSPDSSSLKDRLEVIDLLLDKKPYFMKNLHQELWKVEQENGSPKVRWTDETKWLARRISSDGYQAFYHYSTNTIYITPDLRNNFNYYDEFLSELAHAKQYDEHTLRTHFKGLKDIIKIIVTSIRNGTTLPAAYDLLYETKGSLEHEAHEVNEPQLQKRIERAKDVDIKDVKYLGRGGRM